MKRERQNIFYPVLPCQCRFSEIYLRLHIIKYYFLQQTSSFLPVSDAHFHWSPVTDQWKSQRPIVPTPIGTLVRLKYTSGGLVFQCFYNAADKPAIVFPPDSSLRSVQNTGHVDKCIQTAGTPCFGWNTVKAHHVLYVGSKADLRVTSRSEITQ